MTPDKLLNHITKNAWYRQGGRIIPFFISPYISMFEEVGPENVIVIQNKHSNLGYFGKNQEKQRAYYHINIFIKNFKLIRRNFKLWRLSTEKLQRQLKQILYIPLGDDGTLKNAIKKLVHLTTKAWVWTLLIEDLDPWGEIILNEYTKEYHLTHSELGILTGPNKYSYLQQERIDRYKVAEKYNENAVKNHWEKYYWFLSSWESGSRTDIKYFADLIQKDRKNLNNARQEVLKIERHLNDEHRQRKKLYKKFKFDSKTKKLLCLFNFLGDWRDERKKECMAKINYDLARFLEGLAKFNKASVDLLEYIHISDLKAYKLSSDYLRLLEKRRAGVYITYGDSKHNLVFVYGKKAEKIAKTLEKRITVDVYELRGRPAFPGVIKGKVKVINSITQFKKMKAGDVLVSVMTRPELLLVIKMAGAIITDEGGITCHAAIISREFKIPCVVGTQSATSILKDGDLVEVDANKGVVRLIKKAK